MHFYIYIFLFENWLPDYPISIFCNSRGKKFFFRSYVIVLIKADSVLPHSSSPLIIWLEVNAALYCSKSPRLGYNRVLLLIWHPFVGLLTDSERLLDPVNKRVAPLLGAQMTWRGATALYLIYYGLNSLFLLRAGMKPVDGLAGEIVCFGSGINNGGFTMAAKPQGMV